MSDSNGLTLEEKATNFETLKHIQRVQHFLHLFAKDLMHRGEVHDQSKLASPEVELFTEFTPKLAGSTYGSEEYKAFIEQMRPALSHHYAKNRHHPEHWPKVENPETERLRGDISHLEAILEEETIPPGSLACGALKRILTRAKQDLAAMESSVNGMNLLDIVEMFCDWKAATERHHDGNIRKSIDHNLGRFGLSGQLAQILHNTVEVVSG